MSLLIFGIGGHGRELMQCAERTFNPALIAGFVVDACVDAPPSVGGHPVFRDVGDCPLTAHLIIALGDPKNRRAVVERLSDRTFATLVDPTAVVGANVKLSPGVVIAARATVTTDVVLGQHVHINTGAIVSHDCVLDDYAIVQPGATLCGGVRVGAGAYIGAGAVILPECEIGAGAMVGAGACVTRSLPASCTAVGVPAEVIKLAPDQGRGLTSARTSA